MMESAQIRPMGFGWCGATLEHFAGGTNCCGCAPSGTDFSLSAGYDGECSDTPPSPSPPEPTPPGQCPDICSSPNECRVHDDYAAIYNMSDADRVCYHGCFRIGWCGVTLEHFSRGINCCACAPPGTDFSLYDAASYDGECSAPSPSPEEPCEYYFGSLDGIFTVADADVGITDTSAPYCEGSGIFGRTCTYMHLAGHSCANPAPPDGCHHYHKVQYSECPELDSFNHAYDDNTRIDTTGAFDDQGVFVACADRVISNEVLCFGPPADSPVECVCDSDAISVKKESSDKTCEDYLGSLDGIFTVADPDVGITELSSPYCEGSGIFGRTCTYMHLAGHSCANPAPPDGCHHYHKVQYSECPELDSFNYAYDDNTRIDTTGAFDDQGVFVACADRVISNEVLCFGPPADSPVECVCGSDAISI